MFKPQPDSPNLDRYYQYMENQVVELIRKYDVAFIQFDGEWDSAYTHEIGSKLHRTFHEAKPDILLNTRIDVARMAARKNKQNVEIDIDGRAYAGDFQDRERVVNHGNNVFSWADHPWQAWVTIDRAQWSYNPQPDLLTADELIVDMLTAIGNNGNYMINLARSPTDDSFHAEQIALMDELGIWLNVHQHAIYGTRGGPFYPFKAGVSTRKGKKAWLFITDKTAKTLTLPKLKQKLLNAHVFGYEQPVPFSKEKKSLVFDVSKVNDQGPVKVIELVFDGKVEMQKH